MGIFRIIDGFFQKILRIPYSAYLLLLVPIIIGCVRVLEEDVMHHLSANMDFFVLHVIVSYLVLQIMMTGSLAIASGEGFKKAAGPVAVGMVLAWIPPVLDLLIGAQDGRSYYYIREFSPFFISKNLFLGETFTVWLVLANFVVYLHWWKRSLWRTLLGFLLAWMSMQIFAWGWHEFVKLFMEFELRLFANVMSFVGLLGSFLIYSIFNFKSMWPSLKRINHALPWAIVTMLGSRLAGGDWFFTIILGLAALWMFLLVIIVNDYFDRHQDASGTEEARQVDSNNLVFAIGMQFFLLLWVMFFYPNAFVLLLLFFTITAAYHMPQLRFKRFFCMNYKTEGISGAVFFLFGLYVNGPLPEGLWAPIMTLLVFGGFSGGSMFKDYKDIDEDWRDKVGTIYTRNLKKGRKLKHIHLAVSLFMSAMFVVPPVWMLVSGHNFWHAMLLFALMPLPAVLLLSLKKRPKLAVESTMWAFALYLAALAFVMPAMMN